MIRCTRTICGKDEVCRVLSWTPFDLIDFLLNLERFQVIELGFVRLEFSVEFIFAALLLEWRGDHDDQPNTAATGTLRRGAYRLITLKEHNTTTLVSSCQIVARVIKLDGGNDVG